MADNESLYMANLQERLQIVPTHLSCAQTAQDGATMKTCDRLQWLQVSG
ncbi:MAG: hypothetical protein PHU14_01260 [Methylovulum sp.]|nr:hypothetical protein [Methylovulum sp.]